MGVGGGGYVSTALISQSVTAIGAAGASGTSVSFTFDTNGDLIRHWMNTANAGLLLTGDAASSQGVTYWGDKYNTANFRPELQITYSIPEPASLGLLSISSVGLLLRRRRH